jgi:hypothetical protein
MAYCRKGEDSDLYVWAGYEHPAGTRYVCDDCPLHESVPYFCVTTVDALLEHFMEHQQAGHKVPADAITRALRQFWEEQRGCIECIECHMVGSHQLDCTRRRGP